MVDVTFIAVAAVVALALLFDFTNGFHDAANATATVVATKALRPRPAVYLSAFCNFAALFIVGTAVANTVAKTVKTGMLGTDDKGLAIGLWVAFAALLAAIFWNYFTWSVGMPSSSSHALIGGLVGAGLSAGGADVIQWDSVKKVVIAIFLSPMIAFSVAFLAMYLVGFLQRLTKWEDDAKPFKWLQVVSSAAVSFGHGANDAQKTMGVIAAALVAGGYLTADPGGHIDIPLWAELSAYGMIAMGTMWGGWRIIETMGLRITKLNANSGVAANVGALTSIFGATDLGIPISTTHAAATSVMGAGVSAGTGLNRKTVLEMIIAWVMTVPCAALVGFLTFKITTLPGGWAWVGSAAAVTVLGVWAGRLMMHSENADDIEEMLPEDAELHQFHTLPHPGLPEYEGPEHVNHHERPHHHHEGS
jgi:PiT family inorganic phosphate transporter